MKVSFNWLKEYIDIDITPHDAAGILTDIGLEVSKIDYYESVKGGLDGLVVGHVLEVVKHPDADRLTVCKVDIGREVVDIICGAPNVAKGQKVVVAPVGTTLYPISTEPFKIKKTKIRGVESHGMICAEDEIGLGQSHEGIIVLDDYAEAGRDAVNYFNIYKDHILDIDLTPNRIDAASHIGVARDLAAFLNQTKPVPVKIPQVDAYIPGNNNNTITVEVEATEACIRYSGLTIRNVVVKESPQWLIKKLNAIGLKPINNIVDITNFVLYETGQPLHAFDADKIAGNKVIIKHLDAGTKFITLDDVERELSNEDLMICNQEEGMCIAGVLGGIKSGVTNQTTSVFLESACFNPKYIRKTAKRHGLNTDASFRFERGTDPNNTLYALKRSALLILEIAGGEVEGDIIDIYPNPVKKAMVELLFADLDRLAGNVIEKERVKTILKSLDIQIIAEKEIGLLLEIPTYRVDVTREADVIEEILRIYGYNNIETSSVVNSSIQYSKRPDNEKITNVISDMLTGAGFFEIITNSLTKKEYYHKYGCISGKKCVEIYNPLSQDLSCMRQTLLYGGLETISHNVRRKNNNLKLYEFGKCYYIDKDEMNDPLSKYKEEQHLALFVTGLSNTGNWISNETEASFYTVKTFTYNVLRKIGIPKEYINEEILDKPIFDEGISLVNKGVIIAEIGVVNNNILIDFDLKNPVYYANIYWEKCIKLINQYKIDYKAIPKFPEVRRDLALLLDENILYKDIEIAAFETEPFLLKRMSLFDVYKGETLEKGKKSYAIAFYLQDENKTLTDRVIDKTMDKLIKTLTSKFHAQIR
ncbi:MAG: phenylalanine--tRNA ligase subunit beta [Marinilabiliales bacterium]